MKAALRQLHDATRPDHALEQRELAALAGELLELLRPRERRAVELWLEGRLADLGASSGRHRQILGAALRKLRAEWLRADRGARLFVLAPPSLLDGVAARSNARAAEHRGAQYAERLKAEAARNRAAALDPRNRLVPSSRVLRDGDHVRQSRFRGQRVLLVRNAHWCVRVAESFT